jgi:multiple sugar transport system permease protein
MTARIETGQVEHPVRTRSTGAHLFRLAKQVAVYVLLFAGAALTLLPFAWLVRSSLMEPAQIFVFPVEWIPNPIMWENYREALTKVPFDRFLLNTMTIEVFVVSGTLITSTISAFAFARLRWQGRDLIFGILLTALMLPFAVTLIPMFLFWKEIGATNSYLPLIVPSWFGGGIFNLFLLRQFFMTIPRDLDEAAYLDGATPPQVLWRIILPLSRPALIVVAIFTFIAVWNDFLGPLIYIDDNAKYTLALGLRFFSGMYNAQWDYLMAASTAVILPIIVLFFIAQRYFIEGITLTGIKG